MRRIRRIISALFALLFGLLIVVAEYPRFKKVEKRGPAPESVAATLPGNIISAEAAIGVAFNDWADFEATNRIGTYANKFPYKSKWSYFFLFHKNVPHSLFPSDEKILLDRGKDPLIERYVNIPVELRSRDLYLYDSGDYFWESEYFYKGQAAKFQCSFLIHLEPTKDSGTTVEIFEYRPTIWVGEYFGFSGHAVLPGMLHDLRSAQPTTTDCQEVLRLVEAAAQHVLTRFDAGS